MFCIFCGKQIDDDSVFCPYCGKSLNAGSEGERQQSGGLGNNTRNDDSAARDYGYNVQNLRKSRKSASHQKKMLAAILVVIAVVAAALVCVFLFMRNGAENSSDDTNESSDVVYADNNDTDSKDEEDQSDGEDSEELAGEDAKDSTEESGNDKEIVEETENPWIIISESSVAVGYEGTSEIYISAGGALDGKQLMCFVSDNAVAKVNPSAGQPAESGTAYEITWISAGTTTLTVTLGDAVSSCEIVCEKYYITDATSGDYVFPYSSSEKLTEADLDSLVVPGDYEQTKWNLKVARNEIYARHGRMFDTEELKAYFESKSWYTGMYEPEYFDQELRESTFNEYDKYNAELIAEYEEEHGYN